MALQSGTTSFGKREIHRVWRERAEGGVSLYLSRRRGWAAFLFVALVSAGLGVLALRLAAGAPGSREIILAVLLAGLSFASWWAALRLLHAVTRRGPVMRLDPSRIMLRSGSRELLLPWDDVSLDIGRAFATVCTRAPERGAEAEMPSKIVVPLLLLRGGGAALREAIGRFRPAALERGD